MSTDDVRELNVHYLALEADALARAEKEEPFSLTHHSLRASAKVFRLRADALVPYFG